MSIDTDAGWDAYLRDSQIIDPDEARRQRRADAVAALIAWILITGFVATLTMSYLSGDAL